jgi:hypothetical protein
VVEGAEDEPFDARVARISENIQKRMAALPPLQLSSDITRFHDDLARAIVAIARQAAALGYAMRDGVPQRTLLTEEEAYHQLALSAQLIQVLARATRILPER